MWIIQFLNNTTKKWFIIWPPAIDQYSFQQKGNEDIEIHLNTICMFLLFSVVNNFISQITKNKKN